MQHRIVPDENQELDVDFFEQLKSASDHYLNALINRDDEAADYYENCIAFWQDMIDLEGLQGGIPAWTL